MSAPGKPTEQARVLRRVAVAVAIACTIGVPGTGEAQRLQFAKLTADDGLSGPWVPTVYQDSRGFMWFGTRRGLDRYDGYSITNYRNVRGDTTSIPDNYIEFAREDRDSVLWIGTRKGLSRFDRAHDRFITAGLRLGQPDTFAPTCSIEWLPTFPPVVLKYWPAEFHDTFARGLARVAGTLLGAGAALFTAWLVGRTVLPGRARPMILELPTYKVPSIRNALLAAKDQSLSFLTTAGTVIETMRAGTGPSAGGSGAVVTTQPSTNQLPAPGNKMLAFFPNHPRPAR